MNESLATDAASAAEIAAQRLRQEKADLQLSNERLSRELEELRERLSFVEELVGPTESQRKKFQLQLTSARDAALHVAHSCSGSIPTRCVGRLDESWLRSKGLTDQECSMLQRGCVSGENGVPCDISLLGDPSFCPYDRDTLQPVWEAKGGFLKLSLSDIREKWGEEVALEVMRCAIELDRHDASRRLGVELPWLEKENREMEPAEVIAHMGQQLMSKCSPCSSGGNGSTGLLPEDDEDNEWDGALRSEAASPDDVGEGASRAWSMLEAMMTDLGLNPRSAMTTSLVSGPELPSASHCLDNMLEGPDDTDDEVVQEALEEEGRAEQQREALAEEDIQQMLHDSSSAAIPPTQLPTPQSATQQKASTSRGMRTPSSATAARGSPGTHAMGSSSPTVEALASFNIESETELVLPSEVSAHESLFLQLLEEEVSGNMFIPGSPETSRGSSPASSGSSP